MHWPTALRALSRSALGAMMLVGALAAQNAPKQGWQYDALGNGWITRGSGAPVRLVACSTYHPGYVVSQITADGYLRVQVSGTARRHPLWDQFHEGQRIGVATGRGMVPGVVGVRSTHLWRRRGTDEPPTTVDSLWVDVGAHSSAEARALGIELLDAVARDLPYRRDAAGQRATGAVAFASCMAVIRAAEQAPPRGTTTFALVVQSTFGHAGLSALLARLGSVDSLWVLDPTLAGADSAGAETVVVRRPLPASFIWPAGVRVGASMAIAVHTRYPGTLVESAPAASWAALARALREVSGSPPSADGDSAVDGSPPQPMARPAQHDSLSAVATLLGRLTETYAVSGHEEPMRRQVRAALPMWARSIVQQDTAGNLIVAAGPERDTATFIAHMDEVGFVISGLAPDGTVSLERRGGFYLSLWEGQPALLHFDPTGGDSAAPALRGVFVPREHASIKQPDGLTAWFGLDSAALVARGVRVGLSVTGVKSATRLAKSRFTARSIDDRAGCTALLMALQAIDPTRLKHRVVFVFSVREETGLDGAAAFAAEHGRTVHRVYAVDTFVSSDSPLESPRFAYAPIGHGAVVRALDNSSVTPPEEVDRVVAIARAAHIPIQVGMTNGGNDGSALVRYGAVDIPISWPLRYSHSPAEVVDLADIQALARLVAALATH